MIKGWIKAETGIRPPEDGDYICRLQANSNVEKVRKVEWESNSSPHKSFWETEVIEWLDESPADGDWKLQLMAAIREELSETNRALGIADGFTDDDYKYLGVISAAFDRLSPKQSLTAPEGV